MRRPRTQTVRKRGTAASGPRREAAPVGAAREAMLDRGPVGGLARTPGKVFVIAAVLSAAGSVWIALQPAVTHSPLDTALFGSLLRWILYLPPTLVGVWFAAGRLDRMESPGPGPVLTALAFAAAAVVAGTLGETFARFGLGRGDVLAADGVLQRVLELVRVDVPIGAIAAVMLTRPALPRWFRRTPLIDGRADTE